MRLAPYLCEKNVWFVISPGGRVLASTQPHNLNRQHSCVFVCAMAHGAYVGCDTEYVQKKYVCVWVYVLFLLGRVV